MPKPPAPVTGMHKTSVYRLPPTPRAPVPPKEDFPKRNVVSDPPIAPKGHPASFVPGSAEQNAKSIWQPPDAKQAPLPNVEGRGSSSTKGSHAPVKGMPRGSVGRMLSLPPKRGNIPKDLLGPPLQHQPPPVRPRIPKPPTQPLPKPNLPIGQAPSAPPLPAPLHPPMPGLSATARPPPPKDPALQQVVLRYRPKTIGPTIWSFVIGWRMVGGMIQSDLGIGIIENKVLNSYRNWYALQLMSVEMKFIF